MTSVTNSSLSFGDHYAVLNLDWMSVLINAAKDTHEGQAMIENCSKWNDAVHQKSPQPLTVFSTLSFNPGQPEVQPKSPFANLIVPYGEFRNGSPEVQIDGHFKVDDKDVVLPKTRWSATMGNALEQILRARNIKTVIIVCDSNTGALLFPYQNKVYILMCLSQSGLTLSGVVMSTIYRLFDLDYKIYVIKDNVLELPVYQTPKLSETLFETVLPKMNVKVVSIAEALGALENS